MSADDVSQVVFHRPPAGELGYDEDQVDAFIDRVEDTLRSKDQLVAADIRAMRFPFAVPGRLGYYAAEVDMFLELVAETLESTPQRRQAAAPALGAHATSTKMQPPPRLKPEDVRGVRFHKPRGNTPGYHEGEIDAFLARIEATLRGEDDLTALEVQEIEFGEATADQFGYDEDDVDTFLDLVVVTLEASPPLPVKQRTVEAPLTARDVRTASFGKPPRGRRGYQESQVDKFLDRIEDTLLGQDTLSAQDVREMKFSRPLIGRRGYNEDEVDAFLARVERQLADSPGSPGRIPPITSWKQLRQVRLPPAAADQRGYRSAQVDRMLEEIGIALDGMLGATSGDILKVRFAHALMNGQGYDCAFVDELMPRLAAELQRRGR
ncbi:DivIVA domain-containing protein [Umezawaea tangerina]|uniref:DivIVA domain-containing protein n=1 Tax=Umezawaea tangerina TaxID=84725 RepID=UPI001B800FC9|nr:DivIVA domain-containing protein [Umezawaea tangerina]